MRGARGPGSTAWRRRGTAHFPHMARAAAAPTFLIWQAGHKRVAIWNKGSEPLAQLTVQRWSTHLPRVLHALVRGTTPNPPRRLLGLSLISLWATRRLARWMERSLERDHPVLCHLSRFLDRVNEAFDALHAGELVRTVIQP